MKTYSFNILGGHARRAMKLELDESDFSEKIILNFTLKGQYYEPHLSLLMLRVLRDGDTVLDVGANIGFFSVLAATMVGETGRVVSFEPDPVNVRRLSSNLALNGLEHALIVDKPATSKAGPIQFYINSDNSGGNALWDPAHFPGNDKSQANPKPMTVQATTLDKEVARLELATPKLIKIDTEGADQRVLEGSKKLLKGARVPFVVAEMNEFGLKEMGCSQESLRAYMYGLGYSTFAMYDDGSLPKLIPPATRITSKYILNVLFSTPEHLGQYWPEEFVTPGKE